MIPSLMNKCQGSVCLLAFCSLCKTGHPRSLLHCHLVSYSFFLAIHWHLEGDWRLIAGVLVSGALGGIKTWVEEGSRPTRMENR